MKTAPKIFGRREATPTFNQKDDRIQLGRNIGIWAILFLVFAAGGLYLLVDSLSWIKVATPDPTQSPKLSFQLDGLWAADGKNCEDASALQELKDGKWTMISQLGRIPVMEYKITGSNPVILTSGDGSKVVWDVTNEDLLTPIAVDPPEKENLKRLIFRRCIF